MKLSHTILLIICAFVFSSSYIKGSPTSIDNNTQNKIYEEIQGELVFSEQEQAGNNPNISLQTLNANCAGLGSAVLSINLPCAHIPSIQWSIPGETGYSVNNLAAGNYSVTVTVDPSCGEGATFNFTIIEEDNLDVSINTIGLLCTGSVTATALAGAISPSSMTYLWNTTPPRTTQGITVTSEGTYTVTVTYGNCTEIETVTITRGDFFDIQYTPFICQGSAGSALVNFISGESAGDYIFEWSTGAISQGINLPTANSYSVTVTNRITGCSASKTISANNAPPINLTINPQHISCFGMNDGSATAIATGGSGGFTYEWTTLLTTQTINNLIPGNYGVTVTDGIGCTARASTLIEEPLMFTYTISPDVGICYGQQTTISVEATGGRLPYTYVWADAPGLNIPSRVVSPSATASYTIAVSDASGCAGGSKTTRVIVSQPIVITPVVHNIKCHGECSGDALLNIQGGIAPMTFSWASTTDYIRNLCPGNYTVTVTDIYNCSGHTNFTITEPDTIILSLLSAPPTCYGYTDGYVKVTAIGGVKFSDDTYMYRWNSGQIVDSIAVGAGNYTVSVTDANACVKTASIVIEQPEAVFVTNINGGTICIDETFVSTAYATGGLGPYDFVWYGSDGSSRYGAILNIKPQVTTSYNLTVTDVRGCFGPSRSITVNVRPPLNIVDITTNNNEICIGDELVVDMEVAGGMGVPYSVFTANNQLVNTPYTFYPRETGYYKFRVADECTTPNVYDSVHVIVHPLPDVGFYSDKLGSCPNGVFSFTEINEDNGQTFAWNFGDGGTANLKNPQHKYIRPGIYDVQLTATSIKGCKNIYRIEEMIEIYENPIADFVADPDLASMLNSNIIFNNYSENASNFYWDFGDSITNTVSTNDRQYHVYKEIGDYLVMLVAQSEHECVDTVYKRVKIHDVLTFYAPTAFTPNGDGSNDYFYIFGHGIIRDKFDMTIHDRYGNVVFETNIFDSENPLNMAWDGTFKGSLANGDKPLENGVYTWHCKFVDFSGKSHEMSGVVTLIR